MSEQGFFQILDTVEDDDLIQVIPSFDLGRATDGKWFARKSQINGGIPGFTPSLNITTPNDTINASVLQASGGTTDQDAIISPKGVGAFQLQIADGTSAGGNKRGIYAIDLQLIRTDPTDIASAEYSHIGGGQSNQALGSGAVIGGGWLNIADGGFYSGGGGYTVVAGGRDNQATGPRAVIGGGEANRATRTWATVGGGYQNLVTAESGTISGGDHNRISGQWSFIPGGTGASDRGIDGSWMWSNFIFNNIGDCQLGYYMPTCRTTNDTPTDLSITDFHDHIVLPNNSSYAFTARILARGIDTGDTSYWEFKGAIRRGVNAAATALIAAVTPTLICQDAGASTWVLAVTADTSLGCLLLTVTGAVAIRIHWTGEIKTVELVADGIGP